MTEDIVTWLQGQIARDEQSARAMPHAIGNIQSCWMPHKLIADCQAKWQIVGLHVPYRPYAPAEPGGCLPAICLFCTGEREDDVAMPCTHLRLLALPYADRPGYRKEWGL